MSQTKEAQRAELHEIICRIANDLRGSVDGWDFKSHFLGVLFYRSISENLTAYLNRPEREAGDPDFDYTKLSDKDAEFGRKDTVDEKGFYILHSELFGNVRTRAAADENLNETLPRVFRNIEGSALGADSEDDLKGLSDDLDVKSAKLGNTVAKRYYLEFKKQQADLTPDQRLKVATIFSYAANEDVGDDYLDEEGLETSSLDQSSRDFLNEAIEDYNALFGTSYDTSSDKFQNYYKNLSLRLKNRELDLVIVVNMFLTGFDATTMNALFVGKRLVNHSLIQAYSRTNRILNSVKTYGNIVTFRDLEEETNEAIALFGSKDARGILLLKPYAEYYAEYAEKATELLERFPLGKLIGGEAAQKEFIALLGAILRLHNIPTAFDDFAGNELLSERQMQDYRSIYLNLYAEFHKESQGKKESINDDVVFYTELIKQVEINVDYILMLVAKWREVRGNGSDKETSAFIDIERSVDSSPTLRNKKDLIMDFVDRVSASSEIDEEWRAYVDAQRTAELDAIITEENLKPEETRTFINQAFRDGSIPTTGTAITKILPPASRFYAGGGHGEKKQRVLARLRDFFERFFGWLPTAAESSDQ
jgi:type I restriction enzyme R subunit